MSEKISRSVVLIAERDPKDTNFRFGTGFAVHKKAGITYVVTCRHVIRDICGSDNPADFTKIDVGGKTPNGSHSYISQIKTIDLAVLAVPNLENVLPMNRLRCATRAETAVRIEGCCKLQSVFVTQPIKGVLKTEGDRMIEYDGSRADSWMIQAHDGEVKSGYSGSPVIEADGYVVAVLTHDDGPQAGHAIDIRELSRIWPGMPKDLIADPAPSGSGTQTSGHSPWLPFLADRIEQLNRMETLIREREDSSPVICLIHGCENECLWKFLKCLTHYHWEKRISRVLAAPAGTDPLLIDPNWPDYGEIKDADLIKEIFLKLPSSQKMPDNIQEAQKNVNNCHTGDIIVALFTDSDQWAEQKKTMLNTFLNFWKNWPRRDRGILVAALVIRYRPPGFIKKMLGRFRKNTVNELRGIIEDDLWKPHALPELISIHRRDVENWIKLPEVQTVCIKNGAVGSSGQIIDQMFGNKKRLPMQKLSQKLEEKFLKRRPHDPA
jgi:hypothetical protein